MTPKTLLLTQRDLARLIDVDTAIRVVRQAFRSTARGEAVTPAKLYLPLADHSDFRAMPAWLKRPAACGVKWVNVHPANPRAGLPTVMALMILNDPKTGAPLAVMDGVLITKLRTAAAAAVAAQVLARPESRVAALVGCGAQAQAQLLALARLFRLARVRVWGYAPREAEWWCRRVGVAAPQVACEPCATVERCVRGADLVVTLTPSRRPLVKREWLSPGAHVNAIGADAPGKQELEPGILLQATVVVDDRAQAVHGGELNVPVRRGQFRASAVYASLGEILAGRKAWHRRPGEITVFDSTGLAVHDVALAAEAFRRAVRRGLGRRIAFF